MVTQKNRGVVQTLRCSPVKRRSAPIIRDIYVDAILRIQYPSAEIFLVPVRRTVKRSSPNAVPPHRVWRRPKALPLGVYFL